MPALCSILNSAYYANNYAGIFDAGLYLSSDNELFLLTLIGTHCSYLISDVTLIYLILCQLVPSPTHRAGNILDLILTIIMIKLYMI